MFTFGLELHKFSNMLLISEFVFISLPIIFIVLYILMNRMIPNKKSVCIVVLGDIGRSPRMQYHAMSFAKSGFTVDLVGYPGSEIQQELRENDNVNIHHIKEAPRFLNTLPRLLVYLVKVLWLSISLLLTLLLMPKCGFIMLQNPPSIPTMFVALVVRVLRGGEIVIDWHNYGYTILAMATGPRHPLVRFARWIVADTLIYGTPKANRVDPDETAPTGVVSSGPTLFANMSNHITMRYEGFFGRFASSNICVTKAMQKDLRENWKIQASVMYDRPPAMFAEADLETRHSLFMRLKQQYAAFQPRDGLDDKSSTFISCSDKSGEARYLERRPALLVSSTSWTEDEDFSILLSALKIYEEKPDRAGLPDIVCVITGKGPQKKHYTKIIESQTWNHVTFCLPWLTTEDYPRMLGSADLGVCLHKSSSGLDLPMKIVDMFGCGLPVCAIDFNCLHELVKNDTNGLVFKDGHELAENIQTLLQGFPDNSAKLKQFRKNLTGFQSSRWHENWTQTVLPLFTDSKKER